MHHNDLTINGKSDIRIVFMGTPDFAVASLHRLLQAGYSIVGVVTAPDKPAGRGLQLNQSAVKQFAVANNLVVLQPEKLKNPDFLNELRSLNANVQVVVAFRMLPELVWNMPVLGTINLHASLLPRYRGAAPINWAVINGETETGLTTFKLQHEIDTGNILLTEKVAIGDSETAGELYLRMKEIGAALLVKTIDGIAGNIIKEVSQQHSTANDLPPGEELKQAPKITAETGKIDWHKSVTSIFNLVRGLSPAPAAFTFLNGKLVKIFKVEKEQGAPSTAAGEYETDKKSYLKFACSDGYISIKELQLEGKKKNSIEEFLRGFRF